MQPVVPAQRTHQQRTKRTPQRDSPVTPGQHDGAPVRRPLELANVARRTGKVLRAQYQSMGQLQTTGQIVNYVHVGLGVTPPEADQPILVVDHGTGRVVHVLAPNALHLL